MIERPSYQKIIQELAFKNNKMAFIAGPRQVGKTTLAHAFEPSYSHHHYYTWDDLEFKRTWAKNPKDLIPEHVDSHTLVILDELHKAPKWKSRLKGIYDLKNKYAHICVTGSARLNIFRRGGDSLLGRYFLFRLHPFSLGELLQTTCSPDELLQRLTQIQKTDHKTYQRLFRFGGFPDPYTKADEKFSNVWNLSRVERLLKEDLLDLTHTTQIRNLEIMVALLTDRAAKQLSLQSLAEDLDVSHPTINRWLTWLDQLYYAYQVKPFHKNIARSIKKQGKLYLWNWAEIECEAHRYENMIAGHFLKACHFWQDSGEGKFDLHYLRDKSKREVDFLIVKNGKPWLLAECKLNDAQPSESLYYYAKQLNVPIALQITHKRNTHEALTIAPKKKGYVISAENFLTLLP